MASDMDQLFNNMKEDSKAASFAVEKMIASKDTKLLLKVAETEGIDWQAQVKAIKALGSLASKDQASSLMSLLRNSNSGITDGGTEQQVEHATIKNALIEALVSILKLEKPQSQSEAHIAEFLEKCKAALGRVSK